MIPPFIVMDIEADGLFDDYYKKNATLIWCVCFLDQDKVEYIFVKDDLVEECSYDCRPLSEVPTFLKEVKTEGLICHNLINYDLRMLNKFLDIDYTIKPDTVAGRSLEIVDSLIDSKWLKPKRLLPWGCPHSIKPEDNGKSKIIGPHGLEAWGYRVKKKKPGIEDWEGLHIDVYVDRCIEDTHINYGAFEIMNGEIAKYFDGMDCLDYWKSNRDLARMPIDIEHGFKQDMTEQEVNGVPLDMPLAESLLIKFDAEMEVLRERIEKHLPHIPIPISRLKDYKFPGRPFKQDKKEGAVPSSYLIKFCEKWNGKCWKDDEGDWWVEIDVYGDTQRHKAPFPDYVVETEQMTVGSEHLSQYIIDTYGWKPLYWNFLLDPKTKKKFRNEQGKLVETTPRFKDAATGKICPHLISLEVPFIKDVIRFRTIKHRRSSIKSTTNDVKGYLNHPRLLIDGRLPAGMDTLGAACFVAETLILSDRGHLNWFRLNVGDEVVTHEGVLKEVTDKIENGLKRVYKVCLANGIETQVTGNHPFLTQEGWVKCEDLKPGVHTVQAYPEVEEWMQWDDQNIMASSWGRVKSLATGKEYSIRALDKASGRKGVDIHLNNGDYRSKRVARLVLEAFTGRKPTSSHCLHKNDLAWDDSLKNLYWGTNADNGKDRAKYGSSRLGAKSRNKLTDEQAAEIRHSKESDEILAAQHGLNRRTVHAIKSGERRAIKPKTAKVMSLVTVGVESITFIGEKLTYGITVKDHHSHITDGIITHNTSRVTHKGVCNVPKADDDVLYGMEMRSLFYAGLDPDFFILGYDAAGIEARLEGSEAAVYDGGEYAKILTEEDIHELNAVFFGIKRGGAKSIKYGLGYGAGAAKVGQMLSVPTHVAKEIIESWWAKYWAVAMVIEALQKEFKRNKSKFITGIDGRPLFMGSPHTALNYRLQNAGTLVMKLHACILRNNPKVQAWKKAGLVEKVIDYHDENQYRVHKSLLKFKRVKSEEEGTTYFKTKNTTKPFKKDDQWWVGYCELGVLGCKAIAQAGRELGVTVPLTGDYAIGRNWGATH